MRVSLHPFLQQCLVFDIISFRESDWHDIKNQILFRTKNINWSGAKLKINLPLGKNQYRILSFFKKKKKGNLPRHRRRATNSKKWKLPRSQRDPFIKSIRGTISLPQKGTRNRLMFYSIPDLTIPYVIVMQKVCIRRCNIPLCLELSHENLCDTEVWKNTTYVHVQKCLKRKIRFSSCDAFKFLLERVTPIILPAE